MTLTDFNSSLETFAKEFTKTSDVTAYSNNVITLINKFYSESLLKTKEQLIEDMLNFVITRGSK